MDNVRGCANGGPPECSRRTYDQNKVKVLRTYPRRRRTSFHLRAFFALHARLFTNPVAVLTSLIPSLPGEAMQLLRRAGPSISINTPSTSPVACQSALITWQGGQAPYILSVYSPTYAQGTLLQSYPGIAANQLGLFLLPNVTDNIVMVVQDGSGAESATDPFPLVAPPGRDFSCVPTAAALTSPSPTNTGLSTTPSSGNASPTSSPIAQPSRTPDASQDASTSSKGKGGVIAGVAIAAVAVVALITIVLWVLRRRRKKRMMPPNPSVDLFDDQIVYAAGETQEHNPLGADIVRFEIARALQNGEQTFHGGSSDIEGQSGPGSHFTSSSAVTSEKHRPPASNYASESVTSNSLPSPYPNSQTPSFTGLSSMALSASTIPLVEEDSGIRFRADSNAHESQLESQYPFVTLPPAYSQP